MSTCCVLLEDGCLLGRIAGSFGLTGTHKDPDKASVLDERADTGVLGG